MEPPPGLAGWLSDLHSALAFLTRLPLPPPDEARAGSLASAMRCFPLAGAAIGLVGGLVFAAAAWALTPLVGGLLAVAAMALLSGGLHEDGLADTADGLGGGRDRDDILRIMRDSRIGSYGALALILSVGVRAAALAGLAAAGGGVGALVAVAAVSRGLLPGAMALSAPARTDGLGAGAGRPQEPEVLTALAIAAVIAALCVGLGAAVASIAFAAAGAGAVLWAAQRRIGGYTGDVLGAAQQAAEIGGLLGVLAVL